MSISENKELENFKTEEQYKLERTRLRNQLSYEQFKNLKAQIDTNIKDTRNLELYAFVGLVAYYSWLFTHCIPTSNISILDFKMPSTSGLISWFIPVILPLLGAWRVWGNIGNVLTIADYIAKVENEFAEALQPIGPKNGWENYLCEVRSRQNKPWKCMSRRRQIFLVGKEPGYWVFWFCLWIFTIFMFVIGSLISGPLSQFTCR